MDPCQQALAPVCSYARALLAILGGLLTPTGGEVLFEGKPWAGSGRRDIGSYRRRFVAFVFREHNLLPFLNVVENVAVGALLAGKPRQEALRAAHRVLSELGLEHRKKAMPGELSGGEAQRAAIARALVKEAPVLIADEPTANLNTELAEQVARILHEASRQDGRIVIMATHDLRLRRYADRVLEMRDGVVDADRLEATAGS